MEVGDAAGPPVDDDTLGYAAGGEIHDEPPTDDDTRTPDPQIAFLEELYRRVRREVHRANYLAGSHAAALGDLQEIFALQLNVVTIMRGQADDLAVLLVDMRAAINGLSATRHDLDAMLGDVRAEMYFANP